MSEPSSTIPEDDTFENYSPEYNSWEPSDNCDFKNLALRRPPREKGVVCARRGGGYGKAEDGPIGIEGAPGPEGAPGAHGLSGQPGSTGFKGICPKYCAIDGGIFSRMAHDAMATDATIAQLTKLLVEQQQMMKLQSQQIDRLIVLQNTAPAAAAPRNCRQFYGFAHLRQKIQQWSETLNCFQGKYFEGRLKTKYAASKKRHTVALFAGK
ncbi:hypothetical protein GPALN_009740 [Globodera pallida]|nr:hypothetical protein GPALN_009740 [Globodera pallida]